jgi:hypothetical protein
MPGLSHGIQAAQTPPQGQAIYDVAFISGAWRIRHMVRRPTNCLGIVAAKMLPASCAFFLPDAGA